MLHFRLRENEKKTGLPWWSYSENVPTFMEEHWYSLICKINSLRLHCVRWQFYFSISSFHEVTNCVALCLAKWMSWTTSFSTKKELWETTNQVNLQIEETISFQGKFECDFLFINISFTDRVISTWFFHESRCFFSLEAILLWGHFSSTSRI